MGLFKNDNNDHENIDETEELTNETTDVEGVSTDDSSAESVEESSDNDSDDFDSKEDKICYLCRRPESIAGKMMTLPNNINVCPSCLQRTFDTINRSGIDLNDIASKSHIPNINMINLADLQGLFPPQPVIRKNPKSKTKQKKAAEAKASAESAIPAPHIIKARLDEFVVGQEEAKKIVSVAVYNHYKRVRDNSDDGIEIEKSNILMIGPTGCGKTYLVKTLARILDVPLAIADATSLTEAGYIGDDIESVLSKLLAAADNDVDRAEKGIVFIDEIDKIAKKKNTNQRDVSGESVQQGMLKLLEGADVEVPVGANSKNAMVPLTTINTSNILFICGGAFPELDEIIKERLNKESSMGFKADLKDKYDDEDNLLQKVTVEDVRKYGMIPEFLGRLPVLFAMEELTVDMLVRILKEPRNAIIKQYQKLLRFDEVELIFEDDAIRCIAELAKEKDTGARALRAIIEEFMLDIMYQIPKDDNIGRVIITRDYIEKKGGPQIQMRGTYALEDHSGAAILIGDNSKMGMG